jgi:SOS-response transcriptional repressor LexA
MAERLSPRQRDFTRAVGSLTKRRRGLPPTLAEVAAELAVSTQRAAQLADACAARGVVIRERRVARSLRVVRPTRAKS